MYTLISENKKLKSKNWKFLVFMCPCGNYFFWWWAREGGRPGEKKLRKSVFEFFYQWKKYFQQILPYRWYEGKAFLKKMPFSVIKAPPLPFPLSEPSNFDVFSLIDVYVQVSSLKSTILFCRQPGRRHFSCSPLYPLKINGFIRDSKRTYNYLIIPT